VTTYGLRVGINVSDPNALDHLLSRLPPRWRRAKGGNVDRLYRITRESGGHVVWADAVDVARVPSLEEALDAFEIDVRHFVAECAPRRVFVHAGTVGIGGRAVIVPGRSGTGKSTLVAALLSRGAVYYSDEYAVFDEHGLVHAYPKPLALADNGTKVEHPLATRPGRRPLHLGAILTAPFGGSAISWNPTNESRGHGTLALLDNTVAARRQPEKTLDVLRMATRDAVYLSGVRGEADPTAEAVIDRLEAEWR
jgi:hypothetical protein